MISGLRDRLTANGEGIANGNACENAGLALDRYLLAQVGQGVNPHRQQLYENVAGIGVPQAYASAYTRWEKLLTRMPGMKTSVIKVTDRMIIGMGDAGVLETGVTLQQSYGTPYIPGSALKGLARHFLHAVLHQPLDGEQAKVLFGDTTTSGYITFYDAWFKPQSADGKPLCLDVITTHHPKYYQQRGEEPPSDFDDPIPVTFLTATGDYLLALAGPTDKWTIFACDLLRQALEEAGVGGKTSSGYGRLTGPKPSENDKVIRTVAVTQSKLIAEIHGVAPGEVSGRFGLFNQRYKKLPDGAEKRMVAEALRDAMERAKLLKNSQWINQGFVREILSYLEKQ